MNNFRWFQLILTYLTVDCCWLKICVFLAFLRFCHIVCIHRLQSFHTSKMYIQHTKSCVLLSWPPPPTYAWTSWYVTCQSRLTILRTASTLVAKTDVGGRPSRNLSLKKSSAPRRNSANLFLDGVLSLKAKWSRTMHCFSIHFCEYDNWKTPATLKQLDFKSIASSFRIMRINLRTYYLHTCKQPKIYV